MRLLKIFIASHRTELNGPVEALINYLKGKRKRFRYILHPLPSSKIEFSEYGEFNGGNTFTHKKIKNIRFLESLLYVQHVIINLYFLFRQKEKFDIYIGIDIEHTYIGDLRVVLNSPSGESVVLHDRQGGSRHDLLETYNFDSYPQLITFAGDRIQGDWTLDRKSTRLNSSHTDISRMPSSA